MGFADGIALVGTPTLMRDFTARVAARAVGPQGGPSALDVTGQQDDRPALDAT